MELETSRLSELAESYATVMSEINPADISLEDELLLINPIADEVGKIGRFVCLAASCKVVTGLQSPDDLRGNDIVNPPHFIGVNPCFRSLFFPSLSKDRLVPALVFQTFEPEYDEDIPFGAADNFPFAALPLPEPHTIQAISVFRSNY